MKIIDVNETNVDSRGFFCYMSKKKSIGYQRKLAWLKNRFAEGLRIRILELPDRGFIEKVTSNVHIEGDFDDAQRKRLAQIVTRCPVHKTLAHGIEFEDNATFD